MPDFPATVGGNAFEAIGIDAGNSTGTLVTPSASANVKGSYAELTSATAFSYEAVYVTIECSTVAPVLVDVAIGAAASEVVLIPDLFFSKALSSAVRSIARFLIPIAVPAGARVAARAASPNGSGATCRVAILGIGGDGILVGNGSSAWSAVHASIAKGVVVDPGGSADTKGSWVELISSTPSLTRSLTVTIGNDNIISNTFDHWLVDIATGAGGSEVLKLSDFFITGENSLDFCRSNITIPCAIPAGTRIAARAQSNDITVNRRELLVSLIGVG